MTASGPQPGPSSVVASPRAGDPSTPPGRDLIQSTVARLWDWRWRTNVFRRVEVGCIGRQVEQLGMHTSDVFLDIGSARGLWTQRLASTIRARPILSDIDPQALTSAQFPSVCCTGELLPFRSHSLPLVTLISTLEHVADDRALLSECRRVLRPGGQLVLTTDACSDSVMSAAQRQQHMEESYCVRVYSLESLSALLREAGFAVGTVQYLFSNPTGVRLGKAALRRFRYAPLMAVAAPLLQIHGPDGGLMLFASGSAPQ